MNNNLAHRNTKMKKLIKRCKVMNYSELSDSYY